MLRLLPLLALVVVLAATTSASAACPRAADGHGAMGACAPATITAPALTAPLRATGPITLADTSNNDPLSCAQINRLTVRGLIVKVNQGLGFVDRTAGYQLACARAHGLVVGGYDFVSCYCAAEASKFVALLRAYGMTRTAARWVPPTLDIEYGNATRAGVRTMVAIVRQAFGRVQIYTGCWYWCGRLGGDFWTPDTTGWLAGYPSAPKLPGLPRASYLLHQYTDRGFNGAAFTDMSLWLGTPAQFAAYSAHKIPVSRHSRLLSLYRRRHALRSVIAAHGCRHLRHQARRCQVWFRHGNTVNAQIRALHKQGLY